MCALLRTDGVAPGTETSSAFATNRFVVRGRRGQLLLEQPSANLQLRRGRAARVGTDARVGVQRVATTPVELQASIRWRTEEPRGSRSAVGEVELPLRLTAAARNSVRRGATSVFSKLVRTAFLE
jgi:hypothetical protein